MKKLLFIFFTFNFLVCNFEDFISEDSSLNKSDLKNDIEEMKKFTVEKAINFLGFVEYKANKYKLYLLTESLEKKEKEEKEEKENFIEKLRVENLKYQQIDEIKKFEYKDCFYSEPFYEFKECIKKNPIQKKNLLIFLKKDLESNDKMLEIYEKKYKNLNNDFYNDDYFKYYEKLLLNKIDLYKNEKKILSEMNESFSSENYEKFFNLKKLHLFPNNSKIYEINKELKIVEEFLKRKN